MATVGLRSHPIPRVTGGFIARTTGVSLCHTVATWSEGLVSLFEAGLTTHPGMLFRFSELRHSIDCISIA